MQPNKRCVEKDPTMSVPRDLIKQRQHDRLTTTVHYIPGLPCAAHTQRPHREPIPTNATTTNPQFGAIEPIATGDRRVRLEEGPGCFNHPGPSPS